MLPRLEIEQIDDQKEAKSRKDDLYKIGSEMEMDRSQQFMNSTLNGRELDLISWSRMDGDSWRKEDTF